MSKSIQQMLIQQRDGLLKEAVYIEARLKVINTKITELNTQIAPTIALKPGEPGFECPVCDICGSRSLRCGCD